MNDTGESVDGAVHDVDPLLGWIRLPAERGRSHQQLGRAPH
jgi:hypothetical protein